MLRAIIFLTFLLFFGRNALAQDVHLSQFYTAQLNLNPAMGGAYDGESRLCSNYRNQWREINDPITTVTLAYDTKIDFYSDEINAGLLVIRDQFAGFNLNTSKIFLSGAYRKKIGSHHLSVGVQAGYVIKSTDLDKQTFPNQWVYESGVFNQSLPNQEDALRDGQDFLDLNAGLAWSKRFSSKFSSSAGLSLFHINRPGDSYHSGAVENLRTRKAVHADASIYIKDDLILAPKLLYMWTTKAQDMMVGGLLKKQLNDLKIRHVYAGLLYRGGIDRNPDAVIPVIGINLNKVDLGLSYDLTVSDLSASGPKSTFELSLIYTTPSFAPKSLSIPCDRY